MFEVVTLVAPNVRPWNAPRNAMIPGRPVVRRASLSAPSIASDPEFMNRTLSSGSGNVAARRRASSTVGSLKPIAWTGPISRSTWAWIAAVTRGCVWPSDVTAIPLAKSRYSRPAVSYSRWPMPCDQLRSMYRPSTGDMLGAARAARSRAEGSSMVSTARV